MSRPTRPWRDVLMISAIQPHGGESPDRLRELHADMPPGGHRRDRVQAASSRRPFGAGDGGGIAHEGSGLRPEMGPSDMSPSGWTEDWGRHWSATAPRQRGWSTWPTFSSSVWPGLDALGPCGRDLDRRGHRLVLSSPSERCSAGRGDVHRVPRVLHFGTSQSQNGRSRTRMTSAALTVT